MKKRIYLKESQLARLMSEGLLDDNMYARENHFKNQEAPKTNRLKTEFEGSNTINMSYDEDSNRLYISVRNAYDTGNNAKEYVYDGNTEYDLEKGYLETNRKMTKLFYVVKDGKKKIKKEITNPLSIENLKIYFPLNN